jgi:hypothetical protein
MSLKHHDLKDTVLDEISIDEFEPKAGAEQDTIVVAFYLVDQPPAEDLNTFIQRGFVETLDVEVSPSTDEDGRYLVFVEMHRNNMFMDRLTALLRDISNLTGESNWRARTYYSAGKTFSVEDPELLSYLILDPDAYIPKDKFKMNKIKESVDRFFKSSYANGLTVEGTQIKISDSRAAIVAEFVDAGDYDSVIGRNFLSESAFRLSQIPYEARILEGILGNCQVLPIGEFLCISKDDQVVLLKNTQIDYRKN